MSAASEKRLLVIAPDPDLRQSLDFALTAEGYDVTAMPQRNGQDPAGFDLLILDNAALRGDPRDVADYCNRSKAVILLSDSPSEALPLFAGQVLEKPALGPALIRAVAWALRRSRTGTK